MYWSWDYAWDITDKVGIIIGILAGFFSFSVWLKLRRQHKLIKELARSTPELSNWEEEQSYFSKVFSTNPYVLCISVTPGSVGIINDVKHFISIDDNLKSKISKQNFIEININGLPSPEKRKEFKLELLKSKETLNALGATELHVFFQGPIAAGILFGAVFDNWKPVKIYHKTQGGTGYEFWYPLIKN